ncbi:MAG: hypothetical protein LBJ20_02635 [Candidatus Methanoplasma sp.]|nr:hypothetical protein [Candidatus Methanoplasma sp.]
MDARWNYVFAAVAFILLAVNLGMIVNGRDDDISVIYAKVSSDSDQDIH